MNSITIKKVLSFFRVNLIKKSVKYLKFLCLLFAPNEFLFFEVFLYFFPETPLA